MGSDELKKAQQAFALHYVTRAEEAMQQLWGPNHQAAVDFLKREHTNCTEAFRVLFDSDRAMGLRLIAAASTVAFELGTAPEEARLWVDWGERYHEGCKDMPPSPSRARLAFVRGWVRYFRQTTPEMPAQTIGQCWEEAVQLARACGDLPTLARAQVCRSMAGGDLPSDTRAALAREAIANARACGQPMVLAYVLEISATNKSSGKDLTANRKDMEEALAIVERIGTKPLLAGYVNAMGRVYWQEGLYADATPWFERADAMVRELKLPPLWFSYDLPGNYIDIGQPARARPLAREVFSAAVSAGDPLLTGSGLICYTLLAFAEGKHERGAKLYTAWLAQVSPGKAPLPEHLALVDEAARRAIQECWSSGKPMSMDEAVAFVKEDW